MRAGLEAFAPALTPVKAYWLHWKGQFHRRVERQISATPTGSDNLQPMDIRDTTKAGGGSRVPTQAGLRETGVDDLNSGSDRGEPGRSKPGRRPLDRVEA